MNVLIRVFFILLLGSHVLLSRRPTEINAAVVLHIASLAALLAVLFVGATLGRSGFRKHRFSAWIFCFVFYFYTIGILTSAQGDATPREIIEFPYRISNLLIALLFPFWIKSADDLKFVLRACFAFVVVQTARDLIVFGMAHGSGAIGERLAGADFGSLIMLATPGFVLGWMAADWAAIRRSRLLKLVLATTVIMVGVRIVIMYSRTLWFAIIPADLFLILFLFRGTGLRRIRRPVLAGVIGLLLVGGGVIMSSKAVQDIITARLTLLDYSVSIKQDEFRAVLHAAEDNLLFGIGFAGEVEFQKGIHYRVQAHVHNIFLQFLLSAGLFGLVLVLWGMGLLARECWRLYSRARHPLEYAVSVATVLTLVNIFILGSVQSVSRREHTYLMIAICIILLTAVDKIRPKAALLVSRSRPMRSMRATHDLAARCLAASAPLDAEKRK